MSGKGKDMRMSFQGPAVTDARVKMWKSAAVPPAYTTAWYADKPEATETLAIAVDAKGKRHHYYRTDVTARRTKSKFCAVAKQGPAGTALLHSSLRAATRSALH